MYDRTEAARESQHDHQVLRDEWVRNKANELAELFPELVTDFATPFGNSKFYVKLIGDEDAQDAYATFVDTFCLAKAEKQARENEFLHGSYSEVA
jgi:hypothetical protein